MAPSVNTTKAKDSATSTPPKPTSKPMLVVDKHYCNPSAKIVLISKDNVVFKADTWYMARKSCFIADLIKIPSEQLLEQSPIHLDHNQDIVRLFVDLMSMSTAMLINLDIKGYKESYKEYLALADLFQAASIGDYIMQCVLQDMKHPTGGKPQLDAWDVFKLAAERNDLELAKAAIRCFTLSGYDVASILGSNKPAFFDGVPPRYVYALTQSTFKVPASNDGYLHQTRHGLVRQPSQIADDFTLV